MQPLTSLLQYLIITFDTTCLKCARLRAGGDPYLWQRRVRRGIRVKIYAKSNMWTPASVVCHWEYRSSQR